MSKTKTPPHAPRLKPRIRPSLTRGAAPVGAAVGAPAISVRLELLTLRSAIEGVRILADSVRYGAAQDRREARKAFAAVSAIAAIAEARLRLIDAVIAGDLDANLLLARHNTVTANEKDHRTDLIIPVSIRPDLKRGK